MKTKPKYLESPFKWLTIKERAGYILHIANFTHKEIMEALGVSLRSVTRYISKGKRFHNL